MKSRVTANGVKGPIDVGSSNGSIMIEMNAGVSQVRARTSNSSITVRIPATAAARLRASTSNSNISSAFETDYQHKDRHNMEGSINSGTSTSPLIDLTTSNGGIHIEKL